MFPKYCSHVITLFINVLNVDQIQLNNTCLWLYQAWSWTRARSWALWWACWRCWWPSSSSCSPRPPTGGALQVSYMISWLSFVYDPCFYVLESCLRDAFLDIELSFKSPVKTILKSYYMYENLFMFTLLSLLIFQDSNTEECKIYYFQILKRNFTNCFSSIKPLHQTRFRFQNKNCKVSTQHFQYSQQSFYLP